MPNARHARRTHYVQRSLEDIQRSGGENVSLANILWMVLVVLVVLWLVGLVANIGGGTPLIHILLVVAAIILIYNLFVGRRTV